MRFNRFAPGLLVVMACLCLPLAAGAATLKNADLLTDAYLRYSYSKASDYRDKIRSFFRIILLTYFYLEIS